MRRHVGSNPYCELCSKEIETESHIFFGCPFLSSIWPAAPFSIAIKPTVQNFAAGVRLLKEVLEEATFGLACVSVLEYLEFQE